MRLHFTSGYHPEGDGQMECANQVLEQYLQVYMDFQQDDWATLLLSLCDVLLQLCLDMFQVSHKHLCFGQQCFDLWVQCKLQVIPFVCEKWGHSCHCICGIVVGKFSHQK